MVSYVSARSHKFGRQGQSHFDDEDENGQDASGSYEYGGGDYDDDDDDDDDDYDDEEDDEADEESDSDNSDESHDDAELKK